VHVRGQVREDRGPRARRFRPTLLLRIRASRDGVTGASRSWASGRRPTRQAPAAKLVKGSGPSWGGPAVRRRGVGRSGGGCRVRQGERVAGRAAGAGRLRVPPRALGEGRTHRAGSRAGRWRTYRTFDHLIGGGCQFFGGIRSAKPDF
jgi:hypothetical protein